jgi:hypothetical protein
MHRARRFGNIEHHRSIGNGLRSGPKWVQAYLSITLSVGCYNPGTVLNPTRPVENHIELHQGALTRRLDTPILFAILTADRAHSGRFRRKPPLNEARLRTHCYDLAKRI